MRSTVGLGGSGRRPDNLVHEAPAGDFLTERERAHGRALLLRQVGRGLKSVYPIEEDHPNGKLKEALGRCLRSIERANAPKG